MKTRSFAFCSCFRYGVCVFEWLVIPSLPNFENVNFAKTEIYFLIKRKIVENAGFGFTIMAKMRISQKFAKCLANLHNYFCLLEQNVHLAFLKFWSQPWINEAQIPSLKGCVSFVSILKTVNVVESEFAFSWLRISHYSRFDDLVGFFSGFHLHQQQQAEGLVEFEKIFLFIHWRIFSPWCIPNLLF